MITKVDVVLPNHSQYGVQEHFTHKIAEAFRRRGLSCRELAGKDRFLVPFNDPPQLTFFINGCIKMNSKHYLCDWLQVPHVTYIIDPPVRFSQFLDSSHMILACDDRSSCSFLDIIKYPYSVFMPHAVEQELTFDATQERIYDISIQSSFIDCEAQRRLWAGKFPSKIYRAMEEALSATLADETTPFLMALIQALSSRFELDLRNVEAFKNPMIQAAFEEVEMYIKGRDRLDLISEVSKLNVVHVFGNEESAWKQYFQNQPNVVIHPAVSYQEALNVMKQSRIVLNSSIKNKHGAHERIFSGLACGAVVVTNENVYLKENFIHGEDLILFRRSNFAAMNEDIKNLLHHEKRRKEMAETGRTKVMAHHTWDHRIDKLLKDIAPLIDKMPKK